VSASVLIVGGSDDFLRRRLISKITTARRSEGWNVLAVDGKEKGALDAVFATSMMFGTPTLCIVENAEKVDPGVIRSQVTDPDPNVTVVLVTESDKPSAAVFESVPKESVKIFTLPPFYKREEYATNFAVAEAKARGCVLDPTLAGALVKKVGADLGVLSFEILKAATYAGPGTITAEHLREVMAPLMEADGTAVLEALGSKNLKRLMLEMAKYRETRGGDPTIELCGRIITPAVTRWLQAAHMHQSGMSAGAGAGAVGANPWYWEHKVLPYAVRWRVGGCAALIRAMARAQTLVFQGAVSPWSYLESSVFELVQTG